MAMAKFCIFDLVHVYSDNLCLTKQPSGEVNLPVAQGRHDGPPSVQGDGQHGEHADWNQAVADELVQRAVEGAKVPFSELMNQKCENNIH